jgi:hypothetical protein
MRTSTPRIPARTVGLTVEELGMVVKGWSIKKDVLGKAVLNDSNDKIGTIEDLLVSRGQAISYAIIGVGGFLGMGQHDVAIPVHQLRMDNTQISLPGATAESLKALRAFERE